MLHNKAKRILHVTRINDGGVYEVIKQLVREVDRASFQPMVLFEYNTKAESINNLLEYGVDTFCIRKQKVPDSYKYVSPLKAFSKRRDVGEKLENIFGPKMADAYFSLKMLYFFMKSQGIDIGAYIKAFRLCKPDIIHTHHNSVAAKAEIVASNILGIPCISHRHGYKKLSYFDLLFSRFFDSNIYISSYIKNAYISNGELDSKAVVIHNGIDIDGFSNCKSKETVRHEFKYGPEDLVIGIVGRLDWWKGHEIFIKSFKKVKEKIPRAKAIIVGGIETGHDVERNRKYYKYLQIFTNSLGIDKDIVFTGHREDVPDILGAIDIFVHASSEPEPFGLVIIEAMAAGKPVVATAAGGVLEIIEDGVSGLLVPPRNYNAMAQSILFLASDNSRAAEIGLAGRKRVVEKFTIKRQNLAIQKLYNSLLR